MSQKNSLPTTPAVLWRWLGRGLRIVGIAIVFILILDLVAWVGLKLAGHRETPYLDPALVYPGASWGAELLDESAAVRVAWSPYCYWRAAPFASRYVNVNADGLRRTWDGGAPRVTGVNVRVHRVFVFGGSPIFGVEARDDYTIPSLLAKDLNQADIGNVQVIDYGQPGYVSTQELISFLLALRADQRPDLVVFYDGFNDADAAYRSGTAGITAGEGERAREFNLLNHSLASRRRALYRAAAATFLTKSSLGVVLRTIRRHHAGSVSDRKTGKSLPIVNPVARRPDARLADTVAADYLKNLRLADATAAGLGIGMLVYWQPSLATKNPRSAFESRLAGESARAAPGEEQFVREVGSDLRAIMVTPGYRGPRITDLSTILNGQRSCFVDDVNIVEGCNAVIASRLAAGAIPVLQELAARERLAPRPFQFRRR